MIALKAVNELITVQFYTKQLSSRVKLVMIYLVIWMVTI